MCNYNKAIEYYQKSSEYRNSSAMFRLGICHEEGKGVEQNYLQKPLNIFFTIQSIIIIESIFLIQKTNFQVNSSKYK